MITLRDYQTEHVNKVLGYFKSYQAVNLAAFTGFGKTITSLYIANKLGAKSVLIVVPTHQLKMQWKEVVDRFPELEVTVELIHSVHKLENSYDFFVFDEAHMYGLTPKQSDIKMFQKFIGDEKHKETKRLVLTATNYKVDNAFSGKGVAEVRVNIDKGIECGALHDVQLRVITNGLEVLADKLAGIKSHKSFEELAKTIEENNINITSDESKKVLMDCYVTNLVALVNAEHLDKKVLVYTKSIEECEELAKRYELKALREALVLHSGIKDGKDVLEKFKTSSEHNIIFNVNILTAGFDFNGAEVVFDFAFSQSNESRTLIQRLGRIARYKDGKSPIYYVMLTYSNGFKLEKAAPKRIELSSGAEVVATGSDAEGVVKPRSANDKEQTNEPAQANDLELKKDIAESAAREVAIEATTNIQAEKSVTDMSREEMENTTITEPQTGVSVIEGVVDGDKVPIVVGTWHLKFAGGKSEARRVKISELVSTKRAMAEDGADAEKRLLLEMATANKPKPHYRSLLGGRLYKHIAKDPIFAAKIKKHWPFKRDIVAENKRMLLESARNGGSRPNTKSGIGLRFMQYTSPSNKCYDPIFTEEIRFYWPSNKSDPAETKRQLLDVAASGGPKPAYRSALGQKLRSYTSKHSDSYDEEFANKVLKYWRKHDPKTIEFKALLLQMAENKEPKPAKGTALAVKLHAYTTESSKRYDPEFTSKIREYWLSRSDQTKNKKSELLRIAKSGEPRPSTKTKLGRLLAAYTTQSSKQYDPEFTNKIKHFWTSMSDDVAETKATLLDMAAKGQPRPDSRSGIGSKLSSYLKPSSSSYDKKFADKINKYWKSKKEEVAQTKVELLKIAESGAAMPNLRVGIGIKLGGYIRPSSSSYDHEFTERIKYFWPKVIAAKRNK